MYNLLYSEMLKLKRSLFLWMIPLSVLTTVLLQYGALMYQKSTITAPSSIGIGWCSRTFAM